MSTPTVPRPTVGGDSDRGEESIRAELVAMLAVSIFPATVDELQASLIRRRAPARLMWHLSRLSPLRRYQSMSAVLADLDVH
ncbi:MAG TPA: hypothetical protein VGN19_08830 [Pedococcus sp.]|jgi:hypothetical protein|nr:hypothetical protein [Pedococcus sp.]